MRRKKHFDWGIIGGILACLLFCSPGLFSGGRDSASDLMPVPEKIVRREGAFRLTEAFSVAGEGPLSPRAARAASRLMMRLAGRTGLFLVQDHLKDQTPTATTALTYRWERIGKLLPNEDESYSLRVDPDKIILQSRTDIGVLRGFETLLQLLDSDSRGYYFPSVGIEDRPRFTWRGLLIDACRHFMPVDVVKRNLDAMAAVKLNVMHWHLSEDQGFRVECKTFPKLQRMGSDGAYYTQTEIKDIIAYAGERGIRVMPEFDIPGHSTSWFVGYPEFASSAGPFSIERKFGIFGPTFNPTAEKTYRFFDLFFKEMSGLFTDPYMHIGGDEVNGQEWNDSAAVREFKIKRNLPDNHAVQAYFNKRILQILTKYGKKMVGWDEIFQPALPKDIVIQSWRGPKSLVESAKKGYQGLLSNGYYIDLVQPADFHYLNDPVPGDSPLTDPEKKLILGGEATMWAELVTPETVDSRIWPRTAAIAERLWSPQSVRDVEDMYRRMSIVSLRLEELGLTHIKNQAMMLRRLAGGPEIQALTTLVDVVEPLKIYARHSQGVTYTTLSPMTRLVDAAFPESLTAREFRNEVAAFLRSPCPEAAGGIRARLSLWRDNHARLHAIFRDSPALWEAVPLSERLSLAAAAGLEALDFLLKGERADEAWTAAVMKLFEDAKKPAGHALLAVAADIETLAREASTKGKPRIIMNEYGIKRLTKELNLKGDQAPWEGIAPLIIENYMWRENGYKPKVEARAAYSDKYLYVYFKVFESKIRVRRTRFQDSVYKDSCAEFFVDMFPAKNLGYFNFETNALGTLLVNFGKGRGTRKPLTKEDLKGWEIAASVKKPTDGPHGADFWTLKYRIPLSLFEKFYGEKIHPGMEARANFYKCGDETEFEHYGAWNPVQSPKPDFHRPEDFGKIIFLDK